jgi:hypothetical protein
MGKPKTEGRKASDTDNRKGRKVQAVGSHRKSGGKTKPRRSQPRGRKRPAIEQRPVLEPNAAGIDIGAREMYVAVPPDRDEQPVRVFDTFTADLNELADWLMSCGITTVAMESTGGARLESELGCPATLPIILETAVKMAAAQSQNSVGSPHGPKHSGTFEARADHRLAACFDHA